MFKFITNRTKAFTLAEVLITLGIIGIVAAMTMPTLIENHQKKVLETQYKKGYSVFANALQLAMAKSDTPGDLASTKLFFCYDDIWADDVDKCFQDFSIKIPSL